MNIQHLPSHVKNFVRVNWLKFFYAQGDKNVECPVCGWSGSKFMEFGVIPRPNAQCPGCLSLERHRMIYLYFQSQLEKNRRISLLHFAPEVSIKKLISSYTNIDYVSADIEPGAAMRVEDITKLSFKKQSFDVVYCSHVLEHVEDDIKAMKEIKRVLKKDGYAILQVPIADQAKTYEDYSITDPEQREIHFGQRDHVRRYGRDYAQRLKKAGFKVKVIKYTDRLGKKMVQKYALIPRHKKPAPTEGYIYYCRP